MPNNDITVYFQETFHPSLITVIQNMNDKALFFKSFANFIQITKSLPTNPIKMDDIPFLYTQFTEDFADQISPTYQQRLTKQNYLDLILCLNQQCLVGQLDDLSYALKHHYKHVFGIRTLNVLLILSRLTDLYAYLSNTKYHYSSLTPIPTELDVNLSPLNMIAFYNYAYDDAAIYHPLNNLLATYAIFKACAHTEIPLTKTVLDRLIHTTRLEQNLAQVLPHYLGLIYQSDKRSGQDLYAVSYNDTHPIQNNINHQVANILIKHIDILCKYLPLSSSSTVKKLFKTEQFRTLVAKVKTLNDPNVQQTLDWAIDYLNHLQTPITPETLQIIEQLIHTASHHSSATLTSSQTTILNTWVMQLNDTAKERLISIGHPLSDVIVSNAITNPSLFKPNVTQILKMQPLSRTS